MKPAWNNVLLISSHIGSYAEPASTASQEKPRGAARRRVLMPCVPRNVTPAHFTSLWTYAAAIFIGAMTTAYVDESGGIISFLAIGGTAFVIAFSGPGPRPDMVGSIWAIWGISGGMISAADDGAIRATQRVEELFRALEQELAQIARPDA